MIKGITPIDAAFELIGLCNCQQLTHYIFFETMCGVAVFALGFIFSIWAVASKGTFKPFFTFLIFFFSMWILFIYPSVSAPTVSSTMEQNGFTDLTTAQVLNSGTASLSNNTGTVNPILNIISDLFSSFTIGVVGVIDRGAGSGKANYLKNPMMVAKVLAISNDLISDGIKDPKLRKEVSDFYKNTYLPALQKMIDSGTYTVQSIPNLWPGDSRVTYADGGAAWTKVDTDILAYLQTRTTGTTGDWSSNPILTSINSLFNKTSTQSSNDLVMGLLKVDMKKHPSDYSITSYSSGQYQYSGGGFSKSIGNFFEGALGDAGTTLFQFVSGAISQAMLRMAPYVQGYALLLMFSFFPFVMVIALLERRPVLLAEFVKYLFWIKSWSITWAILDIASVYVINVSQAIDPSTGAPLYAGGEGLPYFNVATAVFMIMLPILSKAMIDGVFSGVGIAATAANLHVDKAVSTGVTVVTKTAGSGSKAVVGMINSIRGAKGTGQ